MGCSAHPQASGSLAYHAGGPKRKTHPGRSVSGLHSTLSLEGGRPSCYTPCQRAYDLREHARQLPPREFCDNLRLSGAENDSCDEPSD